MGGRNCGEPGGGPEGGPIGGEGEGNAGEGGACDESSLGKLRIAQKKLKRRIARLVLFI
jgi:hypothetical protein